MTEQHKATPEQWERQELRARLHALDDQDAPCILELRDRVAALEAAQHAHVETSHLTDATRKQIREELARPAAWRPLKVATETTYGEAKPVPLFTAEEVARIVAPSSPANSLIDRVGRAIETEDGPIPAVGSAYTPEARAAILEVAAWFRTERDSPETAAVLEQEANR
jgi:hypothetical protein